MEEELTTVGVYRKDMEDLKQIMKKGEFFRDKVHQLIQEHLKVKKK